MAQDTETIDIVARCIDNIHKIIKEYDPKCEYELWIVITGSSGIADLDPEDLEKVHKLMTGNPDVKKAVDLIALATGIIATRDAEHSTGYDPIPIENRELFSSSSPRICNMIRDSHSSITADNYDGITKALRAATTEDIILIEKIVGNAPVWEPLHKARIQRLLAIVMKNTN